MTRPRRRTNRVRDVISCRATPTIKKALEALGPVPPISDGIGAQPAQEQAQQVQSQKRIELDQRPRQGPIQSQWNALHQILTPHGLWRFEPHNFVQRAQWHVRPSGYIEPQGDAESQQHVQPRRRLLHLWCLVPPGCVGPWDMTHRFVSKSTSFLPTGMLTLTISIPPGDFMVPATGSSF